MDMQSMLSISATIVSLAISIVGLPIQVWKNYQTKITGNISPVLFILSFLSYTLWSLRAYSISDWYMLLAYMPGVFFSAIILLQIYSYQRVIIVINRAIRTGRDRDQLIGQKGVRKFFQKATLSVAMDWASKIDSSSAVWQTVFSREDVSMIQAIDYAEKYHHSIVWPLVLERHDIRDHLMRYEASTMIGYAQRCEKRAVWEFALDRADVRHELASRKAVDLFYYARQYNIPELTSFVQQLPHVLEYQNSLKN